MILIMDIFSMALKLIFSEVLLLAELTLERSMKIVNHYIY